MERQNQLATTKRQSDTAVAADTDDVYKPQQYPQIETWASSSLQAASLRIKATALWNFEATTSGCQQSEHPTGAGPS